MFANEFRGDPKLINSKAQGADLWQRYGSNVIGSSSASIISETIGLWKHGWKISCSAKKGDLVLALKCC